MTNVNKINGLQKGIMSEFMLEHPNFAKKLLPNCSQGKATSHRLWEQLVKKLNAAGPPIKDVKLWRKVLIKNITPRKSYLSTNHKKKKTGRGPYEKLLTAAEEQLIQATGMSAAVEGLSVESFGNVVHTKSKTSAETETMDEPDSIEESFRQIMASEDEGSDISSGLRDAPKETPKQMKKKVQKEATSNRANSKTVSKLSLLKTNIQAFEDSQATIISKLDKLIELKERSLKIKEEEHVANMAAKKVELEILNIKLNNLKKQ